MAVTVKLNDATVAVGGDFAGALAFVKSFPGRRFDGATKTWDVPTSLKDFQAACLRPLDVLSGECAGMHVTRYGTRYSQAAWEFERKVRDIRPSADVVAQAEALERAAHQQLVATLGMTEAQVARVLGIESRFLGDWDEAEAAGFIRFSSPARKAHIAAACEAYHEAMAAAARLEDDARDAAERALRDEYGYI